MRITIIILTCSILAGCHPGKKTTATLDRDVYLSVYCDLLQESLRGKNAGADPRTAMQNADKIFEKRGVTRAQFDSTTGWFNADVKRWKRFFDDAAKELELREIH